jgi:lycopene cyclase domain-containing protein
VYTIIDLLVFIFAISFDQFGTKSKLIRKKAFWVSYLIILPFQLITNWWLTHYGVVQYSAHAILGLRIAAAPAEDLLYGFSLILLTLTIWARVRKSK